MALPVALPPLQQGAPAPALLDSGGYAGHYIPGNGYSQGYSSGQTQLQGGVPVVDLDSETDSNHDTALTLACAGGHEELVTLLLSRYGGVLSSSLKYWSEILCSQVKISTRWSILTTVL